MTGLLPDALAKPMMQKAGVDRLDALYSAIDVVRRGGTISVIGVYGGMADPLPMLTLFDKQVQLRMGQANVKRWVDDIMPLLTDDDPLGVDTFASHVVPSTKPLTRTTSSRRSRTTRSRSSSSPDRTESGAVASGDSMDESCPKRMEFGPCVGVRPDGQCEMRPGPCSFDDAVRWSGREVAVGDVQAPLILTDFSCAPYDPADVAQAAEVGQPTVRFDGECEVGRQSFIPLDERRQLRPPVEARIQFDGVELLGVPARSGGR